MKLFTSLLTIGFLVLATISSGQSTVSSMFRKNEGQWPLEIKYSTTSNGAMARLMQNEISYGFYRSTEDDQFEILVWNVQFEGANQNSEVELSEAQRTNYNYFLGNDFSRHVKNNTAGQSVTYNDIYNGIDLKYYGQDNVLKYDFILHPGADHSQIKMNYRGINQLNINRQGELEVTTPWGIIVEHEPYTYQLINGKKVEVDVRYNLTNAKQVGFEIVGKYNKNYDLIIDPIVLKWSTFYGSNVDGGNDNFFKQYIISTVADEDGYIYCTGYYPSHFPTTPGVYRPTHNNTGPGSERDGFVLKVSPDGQKVMFATFIGGNNDDYLEKIKLDSKGNIIIAGRTNSASYPTTAGALQRSIKKLPSGSSVSLDLIVSKLSNTGDKLLQSTFYGGSSHDKMMDMTLDQNNNVYLVADASGTDIITTTTAFMDPNSVAQGLLARLSADLSSVQAATQLSAGWRKIQPLSIDIMDDGTPVIAGTTNSEDYPVTNDALQKTLKRDPLYNKITIDNFIMHLNTDFNVLKYSTLFGGTSTEAGVEVAVKNNKIYLYSTSFSGDLPTTPGTYQPGMTPVAGKHHKICVSIIDYATKKLEASSYFSGPTMAEVGKHIYITKTGEIFLSGATSSRDFPTTDCAFDRTYNSNTVNFPNGEWDYYVMKVSSDLTQMLYSTYFGGMHNDYEGEMAVRESENGCVEEIAIGLTSHSSDFPMVNSIQPKKTNGFDDQPTIMKIAPEITPDFTFKANGCNNPVQFTDLSRGDCIWKNGSWTPTSWNWDFGDGTTSTEKNPSHIYNSGGKYKVQLIVSCPTDTIVKTVDISGNFNDLDLGPDKETCPTDNIPVTELDAGTHPGTVTYNWSTGDKTQKIKVGETGKYWVLVDNGECTISDTIEFKVNPTVDPWIKVIDTATCSSPLGSARVWQGDNGIYGPYTYKWSDGQTTRTASGLPAGTYTVKVTNKYGCSGNASVTIVAPDTLSPKASADQQPSCNGATDGVAIAYPNDGGLNGPYTYKWNDAASQTTQKATGLASGDYEVTVTNNDGCSGVAKVSLYVEPIQNLTVQVLQEPECESANGEATVNVDDGGQGGSYTYKWNDPAGQTTQTATGLAAGDYEVQVTNSGGCISTATVTINGKSGIDVTATVDYSDGCDRHGGVNGTGVVIVNAGTPPYQIQWDDPKNQTGDTATGLSEGVYNVEVTDANGCVSSHQIEVEERLQLTVWIDASASCSTCSDGQVTVDVDGFGTPPYTYRWSDENQQTTQTATGLKNGEYTVTVTDDKDCSNSATVTIGGTTGINDDKSISDQIRIYPNPNNGSFFIDPGNIKSNNLIIRIRDIRGRLVYSKTMNQLDPEVHLNDQPDGMYILEILSNEYTITKRLYISR